MKSIKLNTDQYVRRFAIGDIHGCFKTFENLLQEKIQITKNDIVFLLGDYIHKGPDSQKVIDYIQKLRDNGFHIYPIMGNHEDGLIKKQHSYKHTFFRFVAKVTKGEKVLLNEDEMLYFKNKSFLKTLPIHIQIEDYHFVHAGFNFEAEKPKKDYESMLTIRKPYPTTPQKMLKKRKVVHGHTPIDLAQTQKMIDEGSRFINLDTGCAYHKATTAEQRENQGYLTCLNLDTSELIYVKNRDQI
ncbi:metallophosphoesterase [Flammeovirga aprica]|uniref:Serine/threonine protein phosphatase n=1 Tax=Flammeovirga aprica JL-4 TaxID=694437 RepID=A0A7X9NZ68_9BACT|nr:metallophosphoesterase [Flammeovirga aprica]NME66626.1 serine/threonine protein phosphatase [Flammeovirga aprica JL-4]